MGLSGAAFHGVGQIGLQCLPARPGAVGWGDVTGGLVLDGGVQVAVPVDEAAVYPCGPGNQFSWVQGGQSLHESRSVQVREDRQD